jgi:hypothetical protein
VDERQWLLATSYNTGAECLQSAALGFVIVLRVLISLIFDSASMLDEAKRWFEASTVICRFVPNGKDRAEKVRSPLFICLLLGLLHEFAVDY